MNITHKVNFCGTKINVLAYNDLHSSIKNVDAFILLQDEFYKQNQNDVNYTLCGGDMFLDTNKNNEIVAKKLGNITDAIVAGNHDIEAGNYLNYLINKFHMKGKWLSANISYKAKSDLYNQISKSTIVEKNKEKIGVIGVSPFDFDKIAFINQNSNFISIRPLEKTIKIIKKEISKLKKEGINKIFLLAHTGEFGQNNENYYEKFAKIGDIDVIIGGHDHREVDKWYTSELGEPVKIISTGRSSDHGFGENLDYVGKLKLEFDDNGVLIKDKSVSSFEKINNSEKSAYSPNEIIYHFNKPLKQGNPLTEHCEIANIVADSCLWYVNQNTKGKKADFAFVNAGTIRANFDNKEVSMQDIQGVVPFTASTLIKTNLNKKQILNTLSWCALSTTFNKVSPGVMQLSGMEYTINPDLSISDVHILNEDNTIKYNLDDYKDDDEFTAVYDIFLATGVAGLKDLKKDCENNPDVECFSASRQAALKEYLMNCPNIKNYEKTRITSKK